MAIKLIGDTMFKFENVMVGILAAIAVLCLALVFNTSKQQRHNELDKLVTEWHFEHCTPTSKKCGRLE